VKPEHITGALRDILFNGQVEACDGTRSSYATVPITVVQIGLCMTSYLDDGTPTSIGHRLYRHDIVRPNVDPTEEVLAFLEQRSRRSRPDEDTRFRGLSEMKVRALMEYGERALLTDVSKKPRRMGHGSPMPYNILIGSGEGQIIKASLDLLPKLLAEHKRFIFVPSETNDTAITAIANALRPLQYAVLMNTKHIIDAYKQDDVSYRGEYRVFRPRLDAFRENVASKVLIGVYRVSAFSLARFSMLTKTTFTKQHLSPWRTVLCRSSAASPI
jgi:hypothetical protein